MNLCVVQARMGSSRLPGKVLMEVGEKTILGHVISRLSPSVYIDKIVVATTTNPEDDAIASFCQTHGIAVFRGSDWDVLDRFYQAAIQEGAHSSDNIIRICCDNPIHSWKVLDFVFEQFLKYKVDYFSNSNQDPDYLEDGFDVEVTTFDAIQKAAMEATMLSEREHVMPFIKNSGQFSLGWRKSCEKYTYKLSVDTESDLAMARAIFRAFCDKPDFSIEDVTELLEQNPELLELNKESEINSGYRKSLSEDRPVK